MSNYSLKWLVQRITAILLIPLTFWFVYNCILFSKIDYQQIVIFFSSYFNGSLFLIMMVSMLIHAKLGCETIFEDYISSTFIKKITIYLTNIIFYVAILISVISIFSIFKN